MNSRKGQDVDKRSGEQLLAVLGQEIEYTEKSIAILEQRIRLMLQEQTVELGKVARKNMQLGEFNAYLRGLNFTASLLGNAGTLSSASLEKQFAGL